MGDLPVDEQTQSPAPSLEADEGLPEGALLSMLAHELRTPLQSIALSTELSLLKLRGSAEGVPTDWMIDRLEKMQLAARSMRSIVETVLSAAQIEAGRLQAHLEDLDLREVVREVLGRSRNDLSWAGCELTLEAPLPVPGRWDRLLVELVAANLIGNAMKYGAGKPVTVTVEVGPAGARFQVRDNGPGIQPEDQGRIFDRFVRLPSTSIVSGAGLGLWIVQHSVRALRGSVRVESRTGQGACFIVELPRVNEQK